MWIQSAASFCHFLFLFWPFYSSFPLKSSRLFFQEFFKSLPVVSRSKKSKLGYCDLTWWKVDYGANRHSGADLLIYRCHVGVASISSSEIQKNWNKLKITLFRCLFVFVRWGRILNQYFVSLDWTENWISSRVDRFVYLYGGSEASWKRKTNLCSRFIKTSLFMLSVSFPSQ